MGIRFTCPNGHRLNVKPFLSGKRAICPKCGAKMRVPSESQTATVNFEDDLPPDELSHPHDRPSRHNSEILGLAPEDDLGPEDDLLVDEGEDRQADDPTLNDAAFGDDPLTNAALTDAAVVDPGLGDPKQTPSTKRKAPAAHRPLSPPPLRTPPGRPPLPKTAWKDASSDEQPLAPGPDALFDPMSGAAVDEVIAEAAVTDRARKKKMEAKVAAIAPGLVQSVGVDPIGRSRLQRQQRDRNMMLLTGILVVLVFVLGIVLIIVLNRSDEEPAPPPAETPAATQESVDATNVSRSSCLAADEQFCPQGGASASVA